MQRPEPIDVSILVVNYNTRDLTIVCLDSIEPNWFVGIRTPWTLSSAASWKQTHRHAKWVFLALGCACFLLGWYPTVWSLGVVLATGLGGVTWLVLYSYLVWRQDRRLPH